MTSPLSELLRKAKITTFTPPSQLESRVTEVDQKTGEARVLVVDGEVMVAGDEAMRKAALTYLRGEGVETQVKRRIIFFRRRGPKTIG